MSFRLIVGLGNPGAQYARTRHNIGFMVMDELARRLGIEWKEDKKRFLGRLAKGVHEGESLLLLQPLTYMNESGQAVRKVLDFFKLTPDDLLVVVDDVAIPFREMRLKEGGSAGGHNGLKSIERHLSSNRYARLRAGVGDRRSGALHKHVLGRFSVAEEEQLDAFLGDTADVIQRLLSGEAFERVASVANRRTKNEPSTPTQEVGGDKT